MRLHRINNVVSVIVGECVENLECKCVRVVGTLFKICGAVTVEVFLNLEVVIRVVGENDSYCIDLTNVLEDVTSEADVEPFPVEDINTNGFVVLDEDTDID